MAYYLGIDVGTSGTTALVMNAKGRVLGAATGEHPIFAPKSGWSEQEPEDRRQRPSAAVWAVVA